MMKYSKIFEVAYILVAVFFIYEAIRIWNTDPGQAYLFLLFAAVGVFMFFFRRHFRRKYDNRKK